jgi:hypothetical protein
MTRSTPFRFYRFQISLGSLAALALMLLPQAAFAQRAGGHAGGSGHFAGGGGAHIGGGRVGGGSAGFGAAGGSQRGSHISSPIHVFSGPRSAPVAAAPARASQNPVAVNEPARVSAIQPHSSNISASPSSDLPRGFATFAGPGRSGEAAGMNPDARRAMPMHTTIGFPPSTDPRLMSSARGREPISLSGQGRQVWQSSQDATANGNSARITEMRQPQRVFPKPPHMRQRPILAGPPGLLGPPAFIFVSPIFGLYGPGFGCDPFWAPAFGCGGLYPYAFGGYSYLGFGGGYGGYGSAGGDYYPPPTPGYDITPDDNQQGASQEPAPTDWQNPPADNSSDENSSVENAVPAPGTLIYLKDGTSFAVTDYWVADGQLHYITSYGGQNAVNLDQLDLQRTTDENAARGVSITLRPVPESQPPAANPSPVGVER